MAKGNYHPSRISGHQKMLRVKAANEFSERKKSVRLIPIDLQHNDWSS